jgi:hypothetical protein
MLSKAKANELKFSPREAQFILGLILCERQRDISLAVQIALVSYWQRYRLCEAELEQRLTGNRELLPFFCSCDSRSSAGPGERANPRTPSASCYAPDKRTQSRAADNFSRCLRAFSASFDLIRAS